MPSGAGFAATNERLRAYGINTVCSSARCPNLSDCWGRGTATFLLLGSTCTRHCRFCSITTGDRRGVFDETEPERVAQAVGELGLKYVVLTSVDRDDLPDLGAGTFAQTVRHVKTQDARGKVQDDQPPVPLVEVLTPDFGGREGLIRQVVEARPDVFGHNLETVERLSPHVRDPRAAYRRSLEVLVKVKRLDAKMTTKSGLMVGLGETDHELLQALRDLRSVGCDIVTVGQYLQPARRCLSVERYVTPEEFVALEKEALAMGFKGALCGPLVRSSFRADSLFRRPQSSLAGRPAT